MKSIIKIFYVLLIRKLEVQNVGNLFFESIARAELCDKKVIRPIKVPKNTAVIRIQIRACAQLSTR